MADATVTTLPEVKADAIAEKAYAAAAEAVKPAPTAAPAPIAAKKIIKAKAPAKAAAKKTTSVTKLPSIMQMKDKFMATTKTQTEDFAARIKDSVADAQERAKVAYEKSTVVFGDVTEFSKGNVEALVESTKILAAGLQDMGKAYVAESKTALEALTADVKELAAVKSPTDFFKLQGEMLRRNFDAAVAAGSKNSETLVKLAGDAFAPISTRASLAIEKVKQAA